MYPLNKHLLSTSISLASDNAQLNVSCWEPRLNSSLAFVCISSYNVLYVTYSLRLAPTMSFISLVHIHRDQGFRVLFF